MLFDGIEENIKSYQSMQDDLKRKCSNAVILNEHIMGFTEFQLRIAMYIEKKGSNRFNIQKRLYSRYSKVRSEREKKEVFL